jgi:hypothetical protein
MKSNTLTNKLNCRDYYESFDDFLITKIKDDQNSDDYSWGIYLNFVRISVGGCQQKVKQHDNVLFAYVSSSTTTFLKLSGPEVVVINTWVVLVVTDGEGQPVEGAKIGDDASNAEGRIFKEFTSEGTNSLKAEKENSIRSNVLKIEVINAPQ